MRNRPASVRRPTPSVRRLVSFASALALAALLLGWSSSAGHPPSVRAASGPIRAVAACTGWTSLSAPPVTIRVLRTAGPASGTVQTVPFRSYVYVVMAAEWGPGNPQEALRAGAVAVKEYAWYWAMNWRGRTGPDGSCYDVVDSTIDQVYSPETETPAATLTAAADITWTESLRKGGRLFATHYQDGSSVACGANADGYALYQISAVRCAREGLLADAILHRYYDPGLQIVRPGVGDSTGDGIGDVLVVSPGADPATISTRLYPGGRVPGPATTPIQPDIMPLAPSATLFRQLADVNGDRLADLVTLSRTTDGNYEISVALASPSGFEPPVPWWTGPPEAPGITPMSSIRFVVGDFNGDGLGDAAVLTGEPAPPIAGTPIPAPSAASSRGPGESASPAPSEAPGGGSSAQSTMYLLSSTGSSFEAPQVWWSGAVDTSTLLAFAGDVDGDGRADLILQVDMTKLQPPAPSGLRYLVVRSSGGTGGSLEPWLDLPGAVAARTRTVVADVNGDGLADLVIDQVAGTIGSQMVGLLSTGSGFVPRVLWTNATSFRWNVSRIAPADVNGDGRTDIVVLYNAGAAGTRFYPFISTGTSLRPSSMTADPTLTWASAAPY